MTVDLQSFVLFRFEWNKKNIDSELARTKHSLSTESQTNDVDLHAKRRHLSVTYIPKLTGMKRFFEFLIVLCAMRVFSSFQEFG